MALAAIRQRLLEGQRRFSDHRRHARPDHRSVLARRASQSTPLRHRHRQRAKGDNGRWQLPGSSAPILHCAWRWLHALVRMGRLDEAIEELTPPPATRAVPAPDEPWHQWMLFGYRAAALRLRRPSRRGGRAPHYGVSRRHGSSGGRSESFRRRLARRPSSRAGPPGERVPPGQRGLHPLPTARALDPCSTVVCSRRPCAGHDRPGGASGRRRWPRSTPSAVPVFTSLQDRSAPGPGLDGGRRRRPSRRPGQARRGGRRRRRGRPPRRCRQRAPRPGPPGPRPPGGRPLGRISPPRWTASSWWPAPPTPTR